MHNDMHGGTSVVAHANASLPYLSRYLAVPCGNIIHHTPLSSEPARSMAFPLSSSFAANINASKATSAYFTCLGAVIPAHLHYILPSVFKWSLNLREAIPGLYVDAFDYSIRFDKITNLIQMCIPRPSSLKSMSGPGLQP